MATWIDSHGEILNLHDQENRTVMNMYNVKLLFQR